MGFSKLFTNKLVAAFWEKDNRQVHAYKVTKGLLRNRSFYGQKKRLAESNVL